MAFDTTYEPEPRFPALGEAFGDPVAPAAFPAPVLRRWDERAAERIGLSGLSESEKARHFAAFEPLPDNLNPPLAMRYHGHQFRVYNPDIGDGRGFLFAQLRAADGRLLDIGTKGTGRTPWSRTGDGRMTLQGGVREVLIAAFLEAAGVPGCSILSLCETGEALERYDEPSPARGAVLSRVQHGYVRIGTFERHARENAPERITALVDYCAELYFPDLLELAGAERALGLLSHAIEANAKLVATWMAAGFVHGVMNSDNMTVTGESFDYGPSRFIPVFEPEYTAAYFDQGGIYAFARQAESALWNLHRLAECLSLVAPFEALTERLGGFEPSYHSALGEAFCLRFGVKPSGGPCDLELVRAAMSFARQSRVLFEDMFFDWFAGALARESALSGPRASYYSGDAFDAFHNSLGALEPYGEFAHRHAYFQREAPVRLTIDVMRAIWADIEEHDDWTSFNETLAAIDDMRDGFGLAPD